MPAGRRRTESPARLRQAICTTSWPMRSNWRRHDDAARATNAHGSNSVARGAARYPTVNCHTTSSSNIRAPRFFFEGGPAYSHPRTTNRDRPETEKLRIFTNTLRGYIGPRTGNIELINCFYCLITSSGLLWNAYRYIQADPSHNSGIGHFRCLEIILARVNDA